MIASRVPLLALAAFSLCARAQEPAQPVQEPAAPPQQATAPAQQPAPENLTVRVTDENGAAFAGAEVQIDAPAAGAAAPLKTDAQGQVAIDLPSGPHTVTVSVPGFDPLTSHIDLKPKDTQTIAIKLSAAPPPYVWVVGSDGRIEPRTPEMDAHIPFEPMQTLAPLPARTRRRFL